MLNRQTSEQWQSLLHQHVVATKQMTLKHDESSIHEELNLAWAGNTLYAVFGDQLHGIAMSLSCSSWLFLVT